VSVCVFQDVRIPIRVCVCVRYTYTHTHIILLGFHSLFVSPSDQRQQTNKTDITTKKAENYKIVRSDQKYLASLLLRFSLGFITLEGIQPTHVC